MAMDEQAQGSEGFAAEQATPSLSPPDSTCSSCNFDFEVSIGRIRGPSDKMYATYAEGNAYPPLKAESAYKAVIVEANAQMASIDDKLERIKLMILSLEQERARISGIVGKYQRMLRPIHKLPTELLTRIFVFSLDIKVVRDWAGLPIQPPSSLDTSQQPWVLSQVCRSWRKLASSIPALWCFVSFSFDYPGERDPSVELLHSQSFRLQLQLSRCGYYPIEVITSNSPKSPSVDLLLPPLCFHSPKWRNLRISLNGQGVLPRMASITGRLQSLLSLHIKFIGPLLSDFDCFQFAPQLDTLVFSALPSVVGTEFPNAGRLKLPYHQITQYQWYDEEYGDAVTERDNMHRFMRRTLLLLPNLRFCRLSLRPRPPRPAVVVPQVPGILQRRTKVTLKHLVELDLVSIDGQSGILSVLPEFVAPSLRKLSTFSAGPDHTSLAKILAHPAQSLTFLWIEQVEMSPDSFHALLLPLVSVEDLSFGVLGGITDEYLSILRPTYPNSGDFVVVPELRNLTLLPSVGSQSTYSEENLMGVLEARRRGGVHMDSTTTGSTEAGSPDNRCLESVFLDRPAECERLESLRAEGLSVDVWRMGGAGEVEGL
ncbi:hypothetical protein PM082_014603 [Marasmius tenuissimus]|nr:hypothetical protein PM082_014603 [Marasmius tenuissimus]